MIRIVKYLADSPNSWLMLESWFGVLNACTGSAAGHWPRSSIACAAVRLWPLRAPSACCSCRVPIATDRVSFWSELPASLPAWTRADRNKGEEQEKNQIFNFKMQRTKMKFWPLIRSTRSNRSRKKILKILFLNLMAGALPGYIRKRWKLVLIIVEII